MATIAKMLGGALLNAAAFIGGNYLAKSLPGDGGNAALAEKIQHDKALEEYQTAYQKWQRDRTELLAGLKNKIVKKIKRDTIFKTPTEHWLSTIKHTEQR